MYELDEILIPAMHISISLLMALTTARIVLAVLRIMTKPQIIAQETKKESKESALNVDKDMERYFNYEEKDNV